MLVQVVQGFLEKYERHISSVALIGGFVIDNFTLQRVDIFFENVVLLAYIVISAFCITVLSFWKDEWLSGRYLGKVHALLLIGMQFAFGGLFSAFFIFYSRSASWLASAPFLLILLFVLIGNEFFKEKYTRLTVQVNIFFFVLYSYLIFVIPVLLGVMNVWVFLLSGVVSLIVIRVFILILKLINPAKVIMSSGITMSILGIFIAINGLYFLNIIPPIPLSMKDSGIYHSFSRNQDGSYTGMQQEQTFFERFKFYERVELIPGKPVYVYTSVFAPTKFKTDIFHVWEQYDTRTASWKEITKIKLPIVGGREDGFRTFSVKENIGMGKWRVNVETERGQVIGRVNLVIMRAKETPPLESVIK